MFGPATFDRIPTDAQFARPLGDCQTFAVPFNPIRQRAVAVLFEGIRPAAVAGTVALRIVDAIQRVVGWRWSHVGVEVRELAPARINDQPLRTIACEHRCIRIVTALKHARPNAVFATLVESMFRAGCANSLAILASARLRATLQMITPHGNLSPAFAAAEPPLTAVSFVPCWLLDLLQHSQSSESSSRQVDDRSAHRAHSIINTEGSLENVPVNLLVEYV